MKAKILLGALALTLLASSCGKDEPKKTPETGGTTTPAMVKNLALEVGGKQYASGSDIALGELMLREAHDGVYELEVPNLPVVALDKGFVGDGYELVVQKASHLDNDAVGLGSVCLNICPPVEGPVASVTLPSSQGEPSLSIYDPKDEENKEQNNVLIHYAVKGDHVDKAAGQTFKVKLTLRRKGDVVYTAGISFVAKK